MRWPATSRTGSPAPRKLRRLYRTEAGQAAWAEAYYQLAERDHPGAFGAVCARAEAHVLRLSLILALIDGRDAIDAPHIQAALAIWNHAERTAHTIWGERTGDSVADRLLDELRRVAPAGLTFTEQRALFGGHKSSGQMEDERSPRGRSCAKRAQDRNRWPKGDRHLRARSAESAET